MLPLSNRSKVFKVYRYPLQGSHSLAELVLGVCRSDFSDINLVKSNKNDERSGKDELQGKAERIGII